MATASRTKSKSARPAAKKTTARKPAAKAATVKVTFGTTSRSVKLTRGLTVAGAFARAEGLGFTNGNGARFRVGTEAVTGDSKALAGQTYVATLQHEVKG